MAPRHLLPSRIQLPSAETFLNRATITAAVLALAIFVTDIGVPLGVDVGVLYVIPLLIGTLAGPPRFLLPAVGMTSVLTIAGAAFSREGPSPTIALANRVIALCVIWTSGLVLSRFRKTWLALQARTKDLGDVNYALDQAAIVAITDTKGAIIYANDMFCKISRYSRDELLGQDHRILNSGHHSKEFIRNLWVTIANGGIWRGEFRNQAKNGSIYWVDTTIVPFLDTRGKPYQYMAIRYDITERKRSEDRQRELTALARLGEMAAVVAHEVRNPIAGIRGALQVMASHMSVDARDRPVIGDIIARLDVLNGIVEDLLVFARPRQAGTDAVALRALIERTADLLRRDPALARVQVDLSGDGVVRGDAEQLQIVFHNVLVNAAQAMDRCGRVNVYITPNGTESTVAIVDHGSGMPPEVRAKAFDAFFTTRSRGTGLGLPIARRIVEAHAGTIRVDSLPQGGTVATISLPAVPATTPGTTGSVLKTRNR